MTAKNTKRATPATNHRGGTLMGIFIGLVLGGLVAFAIALYINNAPAPFVDKVGQNGASTKPGASPSTAERQPVALPGKPGDKPVEKPKFDFYKILPGESSGSEPAASSQAPGTEPGHAPAPAAAPEQLFLQAGAFQDPADADNLKARLALIGIEASVQQVILPDKGTLNRVRIGPFAKPDDASRVRSQLAQNGIQANVVKGGSTN